MKHTPARLWDFPSAAILSLVLLITSRRLFATHWALGLETAIILTLIGVALGLALGFSKFEREAVFWFTYGYSIPIVILVLGSSLYGGISWLERIADLSDRLAYSLGLFFTDQPVKDTVLFVVFIALLFWIIGLMAGYAMTRSRNFVGAVVPAGVALVIIQLYDSGNGSNDSLLAVYIFLCLLLLGRLTYVQRRLYWKEQRVTLLTESKTDLNSTLAVVALATVMLVWLAPTSVKSLSNVKTVWENLTRPLRDVQKDLGHAVAGLQGGGNGRTVEFFGDALPLGRQAATGETAYLRIQTPLVNTTERYYWRVRSYNIFLNDQWYAENVSSTPFVPDQGPISLADPEGLTGEFTFTALSADLAVLVTPARPVWVSTQSELAFLQVPQGKMDPIQFWPDSPVLAGEQYFVHANVFEPTIDQLRNAGDTYPDWVTGHYLQLPDALPPEINTLAQKSTAHAKTPYDMAVAITNYLRSNFSYSDTVEDPPAGRDPLDWFLFDSRKGFCNYFATAEVILLRSLGIPARMVVGFAQGELDSPNNYTVLQRDSHAWPEVYFPDVGWVEFEPTTSQTPLARQLDESLLTGGQLGPEESNGNARQGGKDEKIPAWAQAEEIGIDLGSRATANFFLRLIIICLIIATILRIYTFGTFHNTLEAGQQVSWRPLPILLKHFFENRALTPPGWLLHWAYLTELNPIERSFITIYRSLHWLGEKPSPAQTPAEAAAELAGRLPNVSEEIYSLLHEYQHHLYGQRHRYQPLDRSAEKVIRQEALRVAIQQRRRAFRSIFTLGRKA